MYCTDSDLLRWEPALFTEAPFVAQTLLQADAAVLGNQITLPDGAFDARVAPGHVITLSMPAGELSLAIAAAVPPRTMTVAANCRLKNDVRRIFVRSFAPQRQIISGLLDRLAGVLPGGKARVVEPSVLRKACATGSLHLIYTSLSAASLGDDADLIIRAELYARLYRDALREIVVELDDDGDGEVDARRPLRMAQFARAEI